MNPFRKENVVGLPDARDKNIYEKTPEQLKAMRVPKKEYGSDRMVNQLNEKINSGENTGEYEEDKLSQQITQLEKERGSLLSDERVLDCYKKIKEINLINAEIGDLEKELRNVLSSEDSEDGGYHEKILILNAKNKDIEYMSEKNAAAEDGVMEKAGEVINLDHKIYDLRSEHKKTFGNQDIKTEQGQYLN